LIGMEALIAVAILGLIVWARLGPMTSRRFDRNDPGVQPAEDD